MIVNASAGIECDDCGTFAIYPLMLNEVLKCNSCDKKWGTVPVDLSLENPCIICACERFYKRKDFNQILGLVILLTGIILSIIYSYFILMGFVLLDVLLYQLVPDAGICYKCSAEFRGIENIDKLNHFDHHTAELYQYAVENK